MVNNKKLATVGIYFIYNMIHVTGKKIWKKEAPESGKRSGYPG